MPLFGKREQGKLDEHGFGAGAVGGTCAADKLLAVVFRQTVNEIVGALCAHFIGPAKYYELEIRVIMVFLKNFRREVFLVNHKEHFYSSEVEHTLEGKLCLAGVNRVKLGERHGIAGRRSDGA